MKRKRRNKDRLTDEALDIAALIDEHFANTERVEKSDNSIIRTTCFLAITYQLWIKANNGSRKAGRLYRRYLKFAAAQAPANRGPEIRYGDDLLTMEEVYRKYGRTMP